MKIEITEESLCAAIEQGWKQAREAKFHNAWERVESRLFGMWLMLAHGGPEHDLRVLDLLSAISFLQQIADRHAREWSNG